MKTDSISINLLFFCYAFFTFAVSAASEKTYALTWVLKLVVSALFYAVFIFLLGNKRKFKPLCRMFVIIYLLFLMAKQIYMISDYMRIYHGRSSAVSTLAITALLIFMFVKIKDTDISYLYLPLFFMTMLLIIIVLVLNFPKVSRYNLLSADRKMGFQMNITLFDYVIPYLIMINSHKGVHKNKAIILIFTSTFCFLLITLYAFMCVNGDLLYSLSPLQMLFQLSSTKLVRNFDALFNFLLYFSYFASLVVLMKSYNSLKESFTYFNSADLLLIIPFFVFMPLLKCIPVFIPEITAGIIILFGREKKIAKEIS